MSKKKKVTAPLTYSPGKGRPKEHLAYLNYQEMQALKRLNGNNQERGPKGLPSFPPADAKGSSSKASSTTRTSGPSSSLNAPARTAPSSSVSRPSTTTASRGPSSSLNAPARTAPSSSVSRPSGSGFAGIGGGGGGGARDSGQAAARQTTQSRFPDTSRGGTAAVSRISGGTLGGNQRDAQFKEAATSRSISKAANTPALKQDAGRSAIGGISKDKSVGLADGSRIKGAIKNIQETAAEAALRRQGPIGPAPQQYKTVEDFNRAFARELANKQFARTGYTPQELNRLAQGLYGEAAAEGYRGMNPAARSMINSIAGGIEVPGYSYLGGSDFDKLAGRYTVFESPNKPFKAAGIGSLNQTQGLFSLAQAASPQSAFSEAADISDRIKNATHYYAQEKVKPDWADKSFERYGQHTFGTADAISEKKIAAAREKIFGAPSYSIPEPIITPTSSTPERRAIPGLISYPQLDRPQPPTVGRSAAIPTSRKLITERIPPEYARISSDPTIPGKDLTPRGKQIYDRVPREGSTEDAARMNNERVANIVRMNQLAEIASESPDYGRLGRRDDRMLYNLPERILGVETFVDPSTGVSRNPFDTERALARTRGATEAISSQTPPNAPTAGRGRDATTTAAQEAERMQRIANYARLPQDPTAQGRFVPAGGMSFKGAPNQMFEGANTPYRLYDVTRPLLNEEAFKSYSSIKRPTSEAVAISPEEIVAMNALYSERMNVQEPEEEDTTEKFRNISMGGGLGMVPFNKPGAITLGVYADQSMDKRERDLQRYYEGEYKMTTSQEQTVDEYLDRADKAIKGGQVLTGVPIGGFGLTSKAYRASVKEKINSYLNATPEEKLAMEKSNPEIIRWAAIIGEEAQSPYQDYLDWADKSGLRAPPSREGGGGGISDIVAGGPSGTSGGTTESPSTQPPAQSGRRPDIYYMWDLGVNIPSPGDPNYTQYQTYLAERLAAQQAMGYV